MGRVLLFPGQAAQFVGMGEKLVSEHDQAASLMKKADEVLGYALSKIMYEGPEERLKETIYTQPAVFVHSMLVYDTHKDTSAPTVAVAGHSLGEISACVAAGVMSFEDGLRLVQKRAESMQQACELQPSTMAAVLGLEDTNVEDICEDIDGVVPANYNCPGQIVISGTIDGINQAIEVCKEQGARRALQLSVGGAFHSPLMEPAMQSFKEAISAVIMKEAVVPVYQNVDAQPHTDPEVIRQNLIQQVTSPVRWTSSIQNMISDGHDQYVEVGGKGMILMGMLRKISRDISVDIWGEG